VKSEQEYHAEQLRLIKEIDKKNAEASVTRAKLKKQKESIFSKIDKNNQNQRGPVNPKNVRETDKRKQPARQARDGVNQYHMIWDSSNSMIPGRFVGVLELPKVPDVPSWWREPDSYWNERMAHVERLATPNSPKRSC
jgi:hypothetical protein